MKMVYDGIETAFIIPMCLLALIFFSIPICYLIAWLKSKITRTKYEDPFQGMGTG